MSAWASLIPMALGIAEGQIESLFGKSWEEEAREKEKELGPAPTFSIPESQRRYEDYMKTRSRQAMPGSEFMEQNIEDTTSDTLSRAGRVADTGWGAQGAGLRATEDRRRRLRKMGSMQEQYKPAATADAAGAVKSRTPYETAQYEYNEWLPWQIQKNEIAALRGAGQQQMMSTLDRGAAAGIYGANIYNTQKMYQQEQTTQYPYGGTSFTPQERQWNDYQAGQQVLPATRLGTDPYSGGGNTRPF